MSRTVFNYQRWEDKQPVKAKTTCIGAIVVENDKYGTIVLASGQRLVKKEFGHWYWKQPNGSLLYVQKWAKNQYLLPTKHEHRDIPCNVELI